MTAKDVWSIDRMSQRLMIYSDGGARGNPGPAAIAFVANDGAGELVKADSRFIGVHTNNQAEYEALVDGAKICCRFTSAGSHLSPG